MRSTDWTDVTELLPSLPGVCLAEPLGPLELAASDAWGSEPRPEGVGSVGQSPSAALANAMLLALERPPCLVSFSGGRDSSLVLAAATRAARLHGLPEPIPVTLRFPAAPLADEAAWQELMVNHLRLRDWVKLPIADELDFVGPVARAAYAAHGLQFPANAHCHAPIFDLAPGGSLLAGVGGDHILGRWRWGGLPSGVRQRLVRATAVRLPPTVRARIATRRAPPAASNHLSRAARRRVARLDAAEAVREPTTWAQRLPWQAQRRFRALSTRSLTRLALARNVCFVAPLLDDRFLAALGHAGHREAFRTRTHAMGAFADLLPPAVRERRTKAWFGEALWSAPSRAAARSQAESGPPLGEPIDEIALVRLWTGSSIDTRTALLLQALDFGQG